MNNILELKGKRFIQEPRRRSFGGPAMNSRKTVSAKNVQKLIDDLKKINRFWHETPHAFKGVLLSVYYNKIVAKSNRIAGLLKGKESNHSIVGAKFNSEKNRHIITYFVDVDDVNQSIDLLTKTLKIINLYYANGINKALFENKTISERIQYDDFSISKSKFKQIVADVSYIEKFDIEMLENPNNQSIITLYNVGMDSKQLLNSIGIDIISSRILDNQTVFMDENQLEVLFSSAPYLVSMSTVNLSTLSPDDFIHEYQEGMVTIPSPTNEPTIGVIDTLFDSRVYFSDWVDFHDVVDSNIPRSDNDYRHGTAVSSIIVDGPRLNLDFLHFQ